MDKLLISGGRSLEGSLRASGAKNSALPILASSILSNSALFLGPSQNLILSNKL